MSLTVEQMREQILGAKRLPKREPVLVPAWNNMRVWVKELTGQDRDDFEASFAEDRDQAEKENRHYKPNTRARMLRFCVCNEAGVLIFSAADEVELSKWVAHELEPVLNVCDQLNKFTRVHREKLEKKFETRGDGATPTGSPGSGESSTSQESPTQES